MREKPRRTLRPAEAAEKRRGAHPASSAFSVVLGELCGQKKQMLKWKRTILGQWPKNK
jgi:hypothetical protein